MWGEHWDRVLSASWWSMWRVQDFNTARLTKYFVTEGNVTQSKTQICVYLKWKRDNGYQIFIIFIWTALSMFCIHTHKREHYRKCSAYFNFSHLRRSVLTTWDFNSRSELLFYCLTGWCSFISILFWLLLVSPSIRYFVLLATGLQRHVTRRLVFGFKVKWRLWVWDFFSFKLWLSICQSERLWRLLVSLTTIHVFKHLFKVPLTAFFPFFLDEWKTKLPLWDNLLLSGTSLCQNDAVCWLPLLIFTIHQYLFMTKFIHNLSLREQNKIFF